jgi:hypothetical protein
MTPMHNAVVQAVLLYDAEMCVLTGTMECFGVSTKNVVDTVVGYLFLPTGMIQATGTRPSCIHL